MITTLFINFRKHYYIKHYYIMSAACVALIVLIINYYYTNQRDVKIRCILAERNQYYIDFDSSMQINKYKYIADQYWGSTLVPFLRNLYQKTNLLTIIPDKQVKIPRLIHQIWLGSPLPEKYKILAQTWQQHNPTWTYKLWTDQEISTLKLKNQDLYDRACNYGEKSDIARYEILYKFGGLYVDTDFECLKSFDIFHYCYDFYIGIQPLDTDIVQLGIGLIAAKPKHLLLKKAIDNLKTSTHKQIIAKTGPLFFTRILLDHILSVPGINTALPASYFYPLGYTQDYNQPQTWLKQESFAVHHWAGSWLKPEAFEKNNKK